MYILKLELNYHCLLRAKGIHAFNYTLKQYILQQEILVIVVYNYAYLVIFELTSILSCIIC